MSTSVVMMDTATAGAGHGHRSRTNANTATANGHHHHHLQTTGFHPHAHLYPHYNHSNNVPMDLKNAMKFSNLTNNNNNNNNNSSNNLLLNSTRNNNNSNNPKNLSISIVSSSSASSSTPSPSSSTSATTTSVAGVSAPISANQVVATPQHPQVQIKLEPRVPSPCTADLAMVLNGNSPTPATTTTGIGSSGGGGTGKPTSSSSSTRIPNTTQSTVQDLSFYFSKTAAASLVNNPTTTASSSSSTTATSSTTQPPSSTPPIGLTVTNGVGQLSLSAIAKHNSYDSQDSTSSFLNSNNHNNSSNKNHSSSSGHHSSNHLHHHHSSASTNGGGGSHSPSPPILTKNSISNLYNNSQSSPPSSQHQQFLSQSINSLNNTSTTLNHHHSSHHGMKRHHDEAFGGSITPSPPPNLMGGMNGHPFSTQHPATPTGGNSSMVASPTSSSLSDYGCKEEMSPSNSVNGYTSVDSLGGDPKKKKGPAPRQQEELCLVCGDRASGYHYNALTCEGCKGFFRRSITKSAVYQCKYGSNCEIDMYMRRKCQECRLKKCLNVGMRPECVVPEYQCAIKREAKRAIKDKDKPNSTTKEGLSPNQTQIIEEKQPLTPLMPTNNWNGSSSSSNGEVVEITRKLTMEQEEIIRKLVFYQDEFESPSEEDIKKIAPFPLGDNEEDNQKRFQHVTEMTILTVQLIVEFSKRVPYFDTLFRDDQITLLKACSSEVMMLRCSRKYDIKTDSIVYANNQPYTRQNYSSACISYVADTLFNFCRRMHMLKVDNAEYALLTAIVIFSDRPQLLEPDKVEQIQEKYIETLRIYVESRPPNKCHFAKLLGILTELRTLGNINSEMCVSLKVQNKKLPPFLAEIWDIQDS